MTVDISIPFTIGLFALVIQILRIGIKNKNQKNKILKILLTSMFFEIFYPYEFFRFVYMKLRIKTLPTDFLLFK